MKTMRWKKRTVNLPRLLLAWAALSVGCGTLAAEYDTAAPLGFSAAGTSLADRFAYRFGFRRTLLESDLEESAAASSFLGGSYRMNFNDLNGHLDLSLDTHFLNPISDDTQKFTVFSPRFAYTNFDRNWFMDFGYAYSRYEASLSVHQWTPSMGFSLNRRDWFQFRGYVIDAYELGANGDNTLYTAAEGSWTHQFQKNMLGLSRINARASLGRRMYAVDQEMKTVQSFGDEQGGSLSFSMHWSLPYNWDVMLQNSIEKFYGPNQENPYRLNYGFFGIERRF